MYLSNYLAFYLSIIYLFFLGGSFRHRRSEMSPRGRSGKISDDNVSTRDVERGKVTNSANCSESQAEEYDSS